MRENSLPARDLTPVCLCCGFMGHATFALLFTFSLSVFV